MVETVLLITILPYSLLYYPTLVEVVLLITLHTHGYSTEYSTITIRRERNEPSGTDVCVCVCVRVRVRVRVHVRVCDCVRQRPHAKLSK